MTSTLKNRQRLDTQRELCKKNYTHSIKKTEKGVSIKCSVTKDGEKHEGKNENFQMRLYFQKNLNFVKYDEQRMNILMEISHLNIFLTLMLKLKLKLMIW